MAASSGSGSTPDTSGWLPIQPRGERSSPRSSCRMALVVGNANYSHLSRLPSSATDAETVAGHLRRQGWLVTCCVDLDGNVLADLIDSFAEQCRQERAAATFFYFSGHGLCSGDTYLLGTDFQGEWSGRNLSKYEWKRELRQRAFRVSDVLESLADCRCPVNIFVLDCDRTLAGEGAGGSSDHSMGDGAEALILYAVTMGGAGSAGAVGQLSPFTQCVVEELFLAQQRRSVFLALTAAQERCVKMMGHRGQTELVTTLASPFLQFFMDDGPVPGDAGASKTGTGLEQALPKSEYLCPITGTLMQAPVITLDGHTYEKRAIVRWLEDKGTSPMTRAPLRGDILIPNRALHSLILEFQASQLQDGKQPSPPPSPSHQHSALDTLLLEDEKGKEKSSEMSPKKETKLASSQFQDNYSMGGVAVGSVHVLHSPLQSIPDAFTGVEIFKGAAAHKLPAGPGKGKGAVDSKCGIQHGAAEPCDALTGAPVAPVAKEQGGVVGSVKKCGEAGECDTEPSAALTESSQHLTKATRQQTEVPQDPVSDGSQMEVFAKELAAWARDDSDVRSIWLPHLYLESSSVRAALEPWPARVVPLSPALDEDQDTGDCSEGGTCLVKTSTLLQLHHAWGLEPPPPHTASAAECRLQDTAAAGQGHRQPSPWQQAEAAAGAGHAAAAGSGCAEATGTTNAAHDDGSSSWPAPVYEPQGTAHTGPIEEPCTAECVDGSGTGSSGPSSGAAAPGAVGPMQEDQAGHAAHGHHSPDVHLPSHRPAQALTAPGGMLQPLPHNQQYTANDYMAFSGAHGAAGGYGSSSSAGMGAQPPGTPGGAAGWQAGGGAQPQVQSQLPSPTRPGPDCMCGWAFERCMRVFHHDKPEPDTLPHESVRTSETTYGPNVLHAVTLSLPRVQVTMELGVCHHELGGGFDEYRLCLTKLSAQAVHSGSPGRDGAPVYIGPRVVAMTPGMCIQHCLPLPEHTAARCSVSNLHCHNPWTHTMYKMLHPKCTHGEDPISQPEVQVPRRVRLRGYNFNVAPEISSGMGLRLGGLERVGEWVEVAERGAKVTATAWQRNDHNVTDKQLLLTRNLVNTFLASLTSSIRRLEYASDQGHTLVQLRTQVRREQRARMHGTRLSVGLRGISVLMVAVQIPQPVVPAGGHLDDHLCNVTHEWVEPKDKEVCIGLRMEQDRR